MKMNKPLLIKVFGHIFVVLSFLGIIFGVSFGIVYPGNLNKNKYVETICYVTNIDNIEFDCCQKKCRNLYPSCDSLINNMSSGFCCDVNCSVICEVICDKCMTLNVTYEYDLYEFYQLYSCNFSLCKTYNDTICWYNKYNVSDVSFVEYESYSWPSIYIITISCVLFVFYIILSIMFCYVYPELCF